MTGMRGLQVVEHPAMGSMMSLTNFGAIFQIRSPIYLGVQNLNFSLLISFFKNVLTKGAFETPLA